MPFRVLSVRVEASTGERTGKEVVAPERRIAGNSVSPLDRLSNAGIADPLKTDDGESRVDVGRQR